MGISDEKWHFVLLSQYTNWYGHGLRFQYLAVIDFELLVTLTLQANYGMGGQYAAHYDPHNYYEDKRDSPVYLDMGDRFATFMVRNF